MAWNLTAQGVFSAGSGVLLVALGLYVALLRPRRGANLGFGAFASGFGAYFAVTNLVSADDPLKDLTYWAGLVCGVVALAGLWIVARELPRPLEPDSGRLVALAAVPGLLVTVGHMYGIALFYFGTGAAESSTARVAQGLVLNVLVGAVWFVLFLLALRSGASPPSERRFRRSAAFLSAALVLYPGFVAGAGSNAGWSLLTGDPAHVAMGVPGMVASLVLAAMWLRNAARGSSARASATVAWVALGMPLIGLLWHVLGYSGLGHGTARAASVVILAVAVARHQILGVDVRIKWTIRQSTLAGAFIAVFFVVSEAAQSLFEGWSGSTMLGIAAAGALVFAVSPLQRVAEQISNAAVPGVPAGGAGALDTFRYSMRLALADGVVTRAEERHLAELADHLGLDHRQALAVRDEVEVEMRASPA